MTKSKDGFLGVGILQDVARNPAANKCCRLAPAAGTSAAVLGGGGGPVEPLELALRANSLPWAALQRFQCTQQCCAPVNSSCPGSKEQTSEMALVEPSPRAVLLYALSHPSYPLFHRWKLAELFGGVGRISDLICFFLLQSLLCPQLCCSFGQPNLGSDGVFCSQISHVALSGLRNWTAPAVPMSVLLARQFKAFLPPKNKVDLGDPWWIIPSELNIFTGYLPNNRFYPPPPKGKEVRGETVCLRGSCVNALPCSQQS